jgi:hypothetical protein
VGRLDSLLAEGPGPFALGLRAMGVGNVIVSPGASDDVVAALGSAGLVVVDLRSRDYP